MTSLTFVSVLLLTIMVCTASAQGRNNMKIFVCVCFVHLRNISHNDMMYYFILDYGKDGDDDDVL